MIKKISKSDILDSELRAQDKSNTLDKKKHIEAINTMNDSLESFRREYQVKERKSQISSANVILTA